MIHSWVFVLVWFCVIPAGGGKQDEGGIIVPLCVWQKSTYLLYPMSPVQLSVLLPPLAHQTSLTFRASFPSQGGKDGKGQRELLHPQPHAGRQLHPTGTELLHGQLRAGIAPWGVVKRDCGGSAILQQKDGPMLMLCTSQLPPAPSALEVVFLYEEKCNWCHSQILQVGRKY